MHLGMSGSFRVALAGAEKTPGDFQHERSKAAAHDHIVFHMSNGGRRDLQRPATLRLHETGCARGAGTGAAAAHARAGAARQRFRCRHAGPCLRRQKNQPEGRACSTSAWWRGSGNIYVCEALHRSHLSPKRKASTIADRKGGPNERAIALVDAIRAVLGDAITAGGSSLRDHRQTSGELGYFQHCFRVYDREGEPCRTPGCSGTIRRIVQSGRSTFYCPICQK